MKKKLMKKRTMSYMSIILIILLTVIATIGIVKSIDSVGAENVTQIDDMANILSEDELDYIEDEFIPNLEKGTGLDFNRAKIWMNENSTIVINMYVELESLGELLVDFNENVDGGGRSIYVASMNRPFVKNLEGLENYLGESVGLQFISSDNDKNALFKAFEGDMTNHVFDEKTWIDGL